MTSQLCFSRTKPSRKAIVPSYRGRVKINTGSLGYLDFGTVSILSASSSSESLDQVEQKISNLTMMMISSLFSLPFFWLMYLEKWCRKSLDMPSNLLIANKYFKWGTTLHNNQKWQSKIIHANFNFLCRNIKASRHEAHKSQQNSGCLAVHIFFNPCQYVQQFKSMTVRIGCMPSLYCSPSCINRQITK